LLIKFILQVFSGLWERRRKRRGEGKIVVARINIRLPGIIGKLGQDLSKRHMWN
jgi:hypothetical protein